MLRRRIALGLATILALAVVAGCGNKPAAPADSATPAPAEESGAQSPAPAQEKIVIRLADGLSETHPHTRSYYHFAEVLKEKTGGRVEVQVFPNGQLGSQRETVEGLRMGTLEMAKTINSLLAAYVPETMVFDLPYIFRDREHFYKVLDGPIFAEMDQKLNKVGLKLVAYFDAGSRSIYTKQPVRSLAEIKGMKIRVPENPLMMDTFNALGASGTPMGLPEIYTSLQQGVLDGAENAPLFAYQQKHHEVAKYFTMTDHFRTPDALLVSLKFYESLPADIRAAFDEAARDLVEHERQLWQEEEAAVNDLLKQSGVEFIAVDPAPWREAVQPVWQKYEPVIGKDLIERVVNTK